MCVRTYSLTCTPVRAPPFGFCFPQLHQGEAALPVTQLRDAVRAGKPLALWLLNHNCGVICLRDNSDASKVELTAYQLQQTTETVMGTTTPTTWFPTAGATVEANWVECEGFAAELSGLSGFTPPDSMPTSRKGGEDHEETREVNSPRYAIP